MSEKKSKSSSKDKDKPPKSKASKGDKVDKADAKSKKSVDDKSKKSAEKTEKAPKKKKQEKSEKPAKADLDLSQDNFSDFMKNPFTFPPPVTKDFALCPHHSVPATLFCETTEEICCEQCLLYGPYNSQMYRVIKIDEAFQARYQYLNDEVCGPLLEKRDRLTKYLQELTVLSDQLRYVKNGVQKLTKVEFNQMLERLKGSSGGKFAILHRQMADLQRDLQAINALGNQFFQLTNLNPIAPNNQQPTPKAIVPFLLRSRYLQEQAQNLIAKPIKTSVDIYPYDLPRELTERKLILQRNRSWIELLKVKDEAIWSLTQQKKGLRGKLLASLNEQAMGEINEWSRLKEKIDHEMETYSMSCKYCGVQLNEQTVNGQCEGGGFHHFMQ